MSKAGEVDPKTDKSIYSLNEVLRSRKKDSIPFKETSTHLPGVSVLSESDPVPDMERRDIGRMSVAARLFMGRKERAKKLKNLQDSSHDEIVTMAVDHKGFRGIQFDDRGVRVKVFPTHKIDWDPEKLEANLGVAFSTLAVRSLAINIMVPLDHVLPDGTTLTPEKANDALQASLIELGFSENDLLTIVDAGIEDEVDEVGLGKMVRDGKIVIPEDTGTVTTTWTVR